jgi:tetratricopeptide (TPR) repeat protein
MLRSGAHNEAAARGFERALAIRRVSTDVRPAARIALGVLFAELGRWEEAYREFTAIPAGSPQRPWVRLGVAAAHVGDTAVVREALAHFEALPADRRGTVLADEARGFIYAALGQPDEAIRLLRRARDRGRAPGFSQWYVRFELDPLRRDRRFRELIAPQ